MEGWYKHYEDHHEFPYITQRFYKDLEKRKSRRKGAPIKFTRKWSPYFIRLLQSILKDHPEFYLDEFVEELYVRSGVLFNPSSVSLVLRKRLGYSLRVYAEVARQRNEAQRQLFLACLRVLVKDVRQMICLDETAKDRNASRRSKAWGRIGEKLAIEKWFEGEIRYTMMGTCDVTGFLAQCCKLHYRSGSEASKTSEGASGTVDQKEFAEWIEDFIVPVVGRIEFNEPQSIVLLDNASVHFSPRLVVMIEKSGGYVLFLPPFSPDFNPIEKMFQVYKSRLKRLINNRDLSTYDKHCEALCAVTTGKAKGEFKSCGIPMNGHAMVQMKKSLVRFLLLNDLF